MRHGRAKAARKTLKYFERTVHLKNKPYYSVLMDATFLTAMLRITTVNSSTSSDINNDSNNNNSNSGVIDTIAGRIERVLQVNGGGSSFSGSRDERLAHVDGSGGGGYNDHDQSHNNGNSNSNHHHNHFNARYFIPQEAVDELEMIIQSFEDRAELTNKRKKKAEYKLKAKVFEDALDWIRNNTSKRKSHRGSGRCEVLPKFTEIVSTEQHQQQEETEQDENVKAEPTISATEAVRRHIARDDGREDEQNQNINNNNNANNHNYNNKPVTRTYIVASQEDNLLDEFRALGTVPILRCTNNASVLILENPSKRGQRTDQGNEKHKWNCSLQNPAEKALVDAAWKAQRRKQKGVREHNVTGGRNGGGRENNNKNDKKRGVKGPKEPNPLSCKRKRSSSDGKKQGGEAVSKSKKRRDRAQRKNDDKEEDGATTSGGDKNGDKKSS